MFLEGLIFIFLAVTGLRVKFAKAIPPCIKTATTAGKEYMQLHTVLECTIYQEEGREHTPAQREHTLTSLSLLILLTAIIAECLYQAVP